MTIAASPPITTFATSPAADRALSEEAGILRELINKVWESAGTITMGEPRRTMRKALDTVYAGAQVDDWDEAGSARVEPSTYGYACQFIQLLPRTASLPDITADTDGEILFEWDQGPRQVFSVSVGRDGTLSYAGLFGYATTHGTEHMHEALPLGIVEGLARLASLTRHL